MKIELFSWGANSYGQLGQGHKEDVFTPTLVKCEDIKPSKIAGGGGHTLIMGEDHKCYSCGWNQKGQLGLGSDVTEKEVVIPKLVGGLLSNKDVVKGAGGWDFSLVITADNILYGFGSNSFGQLGISSDIKSHMISPEIIPLAGRTTTDIACGMRHSVILCGDGTVLTSGVGKKGQLGYLSPDGSIVNKSCQFEKVSFPAECGKPVQVIAGAYHSGALTDTGRVFLWGDNKHGQLSSDPPVTPTLSCPTPVPKELLGGERVSQLHSGWTHMVAVTEHGSIYTWGRSDYGQTGTPQAKTDCRWQPQKLQLKTPKQIVCGSEHNLLIDETGDLYSWGWNEHGICGTGNEDNVLEPIKIKTFVDKVKVIGCGSGHSFVLIESKF